MIRNLKALGLALVAIFAMSAMAASGASAAEPTFTVEGGGTATLDISEISGGEDPNALTAFGRATECPGTTYTGHKVGSATEGVKSGETTVTVRPTYGKCTVSGGLFATVTTNGCHFVFHLYKETLPVGTYPVTADVYCPNESEGIHVTVYSDEEHENVICTLEVTGATAALPNQNQGLQGAHVVNEAGKEHEGGTVTKDDLRVTGTFTGIHVERTGLCLADFRGSTTNNAVFDLNVTVRGTTEGGNHVGLTVTD